MMPDDEYLVYIYGMIYVSSIKSICIRIYRHLSLLIDFEVQDMIYLYACPLLTSSLRHDPRPASPQLSAVAPSTCCARQRKTHTVGWWVGSSSRQLWRRALWSYVMHHTPGSLMHHTRGCCSTHESVAAHTRVLQHTRECLMHHTSGSFMHHAMLSNA